MTDAGRETAPVTTYESVLLRLRLSLFYLAVWFVLAFALLAWAMGREHVVSQALRHMPGPSIVLILLGMATVLLPLAASLYRRRWTLFPDRIDIVETPVIRILGLRRRARVALSEIAEAQFSENPGGANGFDIRTRAGRLYRIAALKTHTMRTTSIDNEGFGAFLGAIERAFPKAGLPRPPGRMRLTVFDTLAGQVVLGVAVVLCAGSSLAALGLGLMRFQIEAIGMAFFTALAGLTGWGILRRSRRARRDRQAEES